MRMTNYGLTNMPQTQSIQYVETKPWLKDCRDGCGCGTTTQNGISRKLELTGKGSIELQCSMVHLVSGKRLLLTWLLSWKDSMWLRAMPATREAKSSSRVVCRESLTLPRFLAILQLTAKKSTLQSENSCSSWTRSMGCRLVIEVVWVPWRQWRRKPTSP